VAIVEDGSSRVVPADVGEGHRRRPAAGQVVRVVGEEDSQVVDLGPVEGDTCGLGVKVPVFTPPHRRWAWRRQGLEERVVERVIVAASAAPYLASSITTTSRPRRGQLVLLRVLLRVLLLRVLLWDLPLPLLRELLVLLVLLVLLLLLLLVLLLLLLLLVLVLVLLLRQLLRSLLLRLLLHVQLSLLTQLLAQLQARLLLLSHMVVVVVVVVVVLALQLQLLVGSVTAAWSAGNQAEALEGLPCGVMHVNPAQQQTKRQSRRR
jgi:hypothetical protein